MKVIVDTCVWSLALRRRSEAKNPVVTELEELVREGRAQLMGAIRQEILSGIPQRAKFAHFALRAAVIINGVKARLGREDVGL